MDKPPDLPDRQNPYHPPGTEPNQQPPSDIGQDAGMRMLLPVGRSGWAIAAGYFGLFSLIVIGAPFALICGILGVREIKKSQKTDQPKHGMGRAIFGIVIGGIVTLLILAGFVYGSLLQ